MQSVILAALALLATLAIAAPLMSLREIDTEIVRCRWSFPYFVHHYVKILTDRGERVPFRLWVSQVPVAKLLSVERLIVLLKARQLGMTWLVLAYAVYVAIFEPGVTILVFSKGQKESKDMIRRIKGILQNLPEWLQPAGFTKDGAEELELTNGSRFISFGSAGTGGDSFTARLAIVDEADLIRDLNAVMSGVKPTIDAGGQLVLLSRSNKATPNSAFKTTYREAVNGRLPYKPIFLPWHARPDRDQAFYNRNREESFLRTGWLDETYSNYPATAEEALAARQQDRRFPISWLDSCYHQEQPLPANVLNGTDFGGWRGLEVYRLPEAGRAYVFGADAAKGNPNSDPSTIVILDALTLEEVCCLCAKIEPKVHGIKLAKLAEWYNGARGHAERNGHGKKLIETAMAQVPRPQILRGHDKFPGWWTDGPAKVYLYDTTADSFREGQAIIHSKATYDQLSSLDAEKMNAPEGEHDDRAVGFALAVLAARKPGVVAGVVSISPAPDEPIAEKPDTSKFVGVVHFEQFTPGYEAWVDIKGERVSLGLFETGDEAAQAVNYACRQLKRPDANPRAGTLEVERAKEIGREVAVVLDRRSR